MFWNAEDIFWNSSRNISERVRNILKQPKKGLEILEEICWKAEQIFLQKKSNYLHLATCRIVLALEPTKSSWWDHQTISLSNVKQNQPKYNLSPNLWIYCSLSEGLIKSIKSHDDYWSNAWQFTEIMVFAADPLLWQASWMSNTNPGFYILLYSLCLCSVYLCWWENWALSAISGSRNAHQNTQNTGRLKLPIATRE